MSIPRRSFLAWSSAAVTGLPIGAAGASQKAAGPSSSEQSFEELELDLSTARRSLPGRVLVLVPRHLDRARRHPAAILFHGWTSDVDRTRARHIWRDSYHIETAYERLQQIPDQAFLSPARYLTRARAALIEHNVGRQPFEGLVMVCPTTPIPYYRGAALRLDRYAEWLHATLMPAVVERAPVAIDRWGLAGVSMGGRVALELLIRKPALFRTLAAVQSHLEPWEVPVYAQRLQRALEDVDPPSLLVMTSEKDPYRKRNIRLSEELERRGLPVRLRVAPGPHTVSWMSEVGALETLLFLSRAFSTPADGPPEQESGE